MTKESTQVQALRLAYQASLDSKADELARMSAGELPEFLHRLAGSSGMYGYDDIANAARHLLARVEPGDAPANAPRVAPESIDELKTDLVDLLRET